MNRYLPEGSLIGTRENREYVTSVAGLERAMAEGRILEGMAVSCDRELNITVDLYGVKGVIPKSEALYSEDGFKDIAVITRVGKAVAFKVMGIEKSDDGTVKAVLSRRAAQAECMLRYVMELTAGDIIDARVTHLEQFGAFVDVGCGIVSLLCIYCISVSRISHPKNRLSVGMPIKAVVKSIDRESGRIYVSHKELLGTWKENAERFHIGQTVSGIVRSVEDYGVFIELTPNLAGLGEITEGISVGDTVAVYIKNIIPERMKIKLVIIDVGKDETAPTGFDYFITETEHIDRWVYSPEES
jgi:small subunit ribosomal protein S1